MYHKIVDFYGPALVIVSEFKDCCQVSKITALVYVLNVW